MAKKDISEMACDIVQELLAMRLKRTDLKKLIVLLATKKMRDFNPAEIRDPELRKPSETVKAMCQKVLRDCRKAELTYSEFEELLYKLCISVKHSELLEELLEECC